MKMDNCTHDWDLFLSEYLPVILSTKRHHPCKDCGLINFKPPNSRLKTGKLISLIKIMFEDHGIQRSRINQYTAEIKEMKRSDLDDKSIIDIITVARLMNHIFQLVESLFICISLVRIFLHFFSSFL